VGPYCIIEVLANHTYRVERSGQISVQSEKRLKPYWASPGAVGQAPPLLEPARRPTGGGRTAPTREWELPYRLPEENPEVREPPPQPIPEEPAPPERSHLHSQYPRSLHLQNHPGYQIPTIDLHPRSQNRLNHPP